MDMPKLKKCPLCKDTWIYSSVGDYGSGYENKGFRVECRCGYAWQAIDWCESKKEAIDAWNRRVSDVR